MIVNLIAALEVRYGAGFVQLGHRYYDSGPWGGRTPHTGSFLPVIYALRNDLTILQGPSPAPGALPKDQGQDVVAGWVVRTAAPAEDRARQAGR